jgi:histidinol dehydrogenase
MALIGITGYENIKSAIAGRRERTDAAFAEINRAVSEIVENVAKNGDRALMEYTEKFDGAVLSSFELTCAEIDAAYSAADPELVSALKRAAERIRDFHKNQVQRSWLKTEPDGTVMGQTVRGLDAVGVYIPGGTAAYPSSVLMNIIPARLAGVREIILATPPFRSEKGKNAILAAARIAGADRVFTIGGAQAIAALAYGTESVPNVDKITGPGNAYVAAAKNLCRGKVDIDMVAGPSEILIIADGTADPSYIAADMLSQAEHDVLASAILITTSREIAEKTVPELERQLKNLDRREIAEKSIINYGLIAVCPDIGSALEVSNGIAPEHLEVMTENPMGLLARIKNAGSVFLGKYSPEPLGDYMGGPNHVLPTGGTARFASPLSVDSFIKKSGFIMASSELLSSLSDDIIKIADSEGLTAHAKSVAIRKKRE